MNEIAQVERPEQAPQSAELATISMIERAVTDPNIDVEKMERIWVLHQQAMERSAEISFNDAMAEMQVELPPIQKRGEIKNKGNVVSTYALWEDVNEVIKPILHKHGFSLTFRTNTETNFVTVMGVLSHKKGHKEQTSIGLPADTSGFKNPVQAVASSVQYGKRYVASALLNLTSYGEDDDGQSANVKPKSSYQLRQEGQWQTVMEELQKDLADCKSLTRLEELRKWWREKVRKDGWNRTYLSAMADEFAAHEELLKRRD